MSRYLQDKDPVQKAIFAKLKKAIVSGVTVNKFKKMLEEAQNSSFDIQTRGDGYGTDNTFRKDCTLLNFAYLECRFDIAEYLLDTGVKNNIDELCDLLGYESHFYNYANNEEKRNTTARIRFLTDYADSHPEVRERNEERLSDTLTFVLGTIIYVGDSRINVPLVEKMFRSGARPNRNLWQKLAAWFITDSLGSKDNDCESSFDTFKKLADLFILYGGAECGSSGDAPPKENPLLKELLESMNQSMRPSIRRLLSKLRCNSASKGGTKEQTAILDVMERAQCYLIDKLYAAGTDINKADERGETALHVACNSVSMLWDDTLYGFDVVTKLLRYGADIEAIDAVGDTPVEKIVIGDWGKTRNLIKKVAKEIKEHRRDTELADKYDELKYAR